MQTHKEQLANYKQEKSTDPAPRKPKKKVKKPFVVEYRVKPGVRGMSFVGPADWYHWGRYATEKALSQALAVFDRKNDENLFERRVINK